MFRNPDGLQLAHAITDHLSETSSDILSESIPRTEHYVLVGGSLLHHVPWKKGDKYGTVREVYAAFTIHHYGLATVVFVGCDGGPSKTIFIKWVREFKSEKDDMF